MSNQPAPSNVIRLKPQQYIHVLDNNTGVTRLEVGPQTITLRDHERLVLGPEAMVIVPPRYFGIVANPVLRGPDGQWQADANGQIKLNHGDVEIRFAQDPFPLYPGEQLVGKVTRLQVVEPNNALRLRAGRDFADGATTRRAGDEWLFEGPGTYTPRVEVEVVETIKATVIKPNQALRLLARKACVDRQSHARKAGEEWLVRDEGAYLPGVDEEVMEVTKAHVLTERKALHLRARRTFTDIRGRERKAGDEWLVTFADAETHIPDVYEDVVGEVDITTLGDREWCIVQNPLGADGRPQLGLREVRKGRASFFLHPGETLDGGGPEKQGIRKVYVLGEQEALLLQAREAFTDGKSRRNPGDLWMIEGPTDYIPPVQVEVVERRKAFPLDKNEGLYVRDIKTGELKLVRGPQAYLLTPYEELWQKDLPPDVENLLSTNPVAERGKIATMEEGLRAAKPMPPAPPPPPQRDRTRAVVFHVPQNAAAQIHDYKARTARVVFGPDLVMLGPDEAFTVLSISGGKPKKPNMIKALALLLGPDFMTDIFAVETADHARLQLQLSYNWHFEVNKNDEAAAARLFQVPDFVGDACKAIASRVRGAVAGARFDEFHRNSARIIRTAVFGMDDAGHVRDEFPFKANGLVITNIDIQSVEPVDEETLKSLQKSVQIAIQITTSAQEAAARHDAERIEQEAKARLERQGIVDRREAEAERKKLIELQSENVVIQTTGQATAEAKAKAEAARIQGEAAVNLARQEAEAARIRAEVELAQLTARQKAEATHQQATSAIEIEKAQKMADITAKEFKERMEALGPDTLRAIAAAGPETQAKLLQGLGLHSVLITDGKSPINLFNTAGGLLGGMTGSEK
jgi:major vault protein